MRWIHPLAAFLPLLALGALYGGYNFALCQNCNWAMRSSGSLMLVGWGGAVLVGVVLLWVLEAFPALPDPSYSWLFPVTGRWLRYLLLCPLWLAFAGFVLLPFMVVF